MSAFGVSSFESIWYWVLHMIVWTLVTQRMLGVPHDMLVRARRSPEIAGKVEILALVHTGRLAALYDALGIAAALLGGFFLSALFVIGFLNGVELAQAVFLLVFPVSIVAYSTASVALRIERRNYRGDMLLRILARRQFWHQVIAVAALIGALGVALSHHPRIVLP